MSKPVYLSKINWAMVILALISILQVVQEWYAKGDLSVTGVIGLIIAVLVVVLRTFGNSTPLEAPKPFAPKDDQSGAIYGEPRG